MEYILNKDSGFYKLLNGRLSISAGAYLLLLAAMVPLFLIAFKLGLPLIALGLVLAVPMIALWIKYPRMWIYSLAVFSGIFIRNSSEGVSALDVVNGVLYIATLGVWLIWFIFVKKEKIVRNVADWLILFLFVVFIFNYIVAFGNGVSLLDWLREYSLFFVILLYFPISYYFTDKKDLLRLLVLFMLTTVGIACLQFYEYKTGVLSYAVYAYQISNSIKMNQVLFTAGSIFGIVFTLQNKKKINAFIMSIFAFLNVASLIFTFSRTFWIILLLDVFLIFFYVPSKQKKKFIFYFTFIVVIFIGSAVLVFHKNAGIVYKVIGNRLTSSTKGTKDISIMSRLAEYEYEYSQIRKYPLGGNGFGKPIHFFDPLRQVTFYTINIHNGYIFLAYRLGLPLSIAFLFFLLYYFFKAESLTRRSKDSFFKALMLSSFLSLLLMLISNFTSDEIMQRDALLVYALSIAFVNIAEKNLRPDGIKQLNCVSS